MLPLKFDCHPSKSAYLLSRYPNLMALIQMTGILLGSQLPYHGRTAVHNILALPGGCARSVFRSCIKCGCTVWYSSSVPIRPSQHQHRCVLHETVPSSPTSQATITQASFM